MSSRMDKYKDNNDIVDEEVPTRSNKNKKLYTQIYNAYDEFENLIVPSNAKEITVSDLKKAIDGEEDIDIRESSHDEKKKTFEEDNKVYDINELINKAVSKKEDKTLSEPGISNGSYLKKLKLDNRKTNIEQVKEMYEDIQEEAKDEEDELLKTANLSLELLSDLKGDNDVTRVSAPIKSEEMPEDNDTTFYSNNYKFSKRDFEKDDDYSDNRKIVKEETEEDEEEDEEEEIETDEGNGKFFFKVLLLIFGLIMIIALLIYLISYFNRV